MRKVMLVAALATVAGCLVAVESKADIVLKTPLSSALQNAQGRKVDPVDVEEMLETVVDISVTDSSVVDVIKALNQSGKLFYSNVELRENENRKVTFSARSITVRNALRATAALLGSEIFVLSDRVLISPPSALLNQEVTDLSAKVGNAKEIGDLVQAAAAGIKRGGKIDDEGVSMTKLDGHTQKVLQRLLDINSENKKLPRTSIKDGFSVELRENNGVIDLRVSSKSQAKGFSWIFVPAQ